MRQSVIFENIVERT